MKYDKTRLYTLYEAHELKPGSKGYFADNIKCLISLVQEEDTDCIHMFTGMSNDSDYIFRTDNGYDYSFFYLVEEPEEKKLRPYKDTDEMVHDFLKRCNKYDSFLPVSNPLFAPSIWVKNKDYGTMCLVTVISDNTVYMTSGYSMQELFDKFTYLDGSPIGIEGE